MPVPILLRVAPDGRVLGVLLLRKRRRGQPAFYWQAANAGRDNRKTIQARIQFLRQFSANDALIPSGSGVNFPRWNIEEAKLR